MSSTAWSGLLAITGTAASVLGVVFSCMAWVQAGRARDAAQKAAEAVRIRSSSHGFSRWSVTAQELLQAVRELRFESAQRSATELLGLLAHNKGWRSGLSGGIPAVEVDEPIRLLTLVNTYLMEKTVFEEKQARITAHCQAIFRRLNELSGGFDAEVEKL